MPQSLTDALQPLITSFATQMVRIVEEATTARIKAVLDGAFSSPKRRPGRPPKDAGLASLSLDMPARRTPSKQLCPVPGCKNPAAPVFGMVCAQHKDVPKVTIKKYREARKAAKAGTAPKPKKAPSSVKARKGRKPRKSTPQKTRTRRQGPRPTRPAPPTEAKATEGTKE